MGVTANRLKELNLADVVIPEPMGGAHRSPEEMAEALKAQLKSGLAELGALSTEDLVGQRYERLTAYDTGR